jgi:hypothetical protein
MGKTPPPVSLWAFISISISIWRHKRLPAYAAPPPPVLSACLACVLSRLKAYPTLPPRAGLRIIASAPLPSIRIGISISISHTHRHVLVFVILAAAFPTLPPRAGLRIGLLDFSVGSLRFGERPNSPRRRLSTHSSVCSTTSHRVCWIDVVMMGPVTRLCPRIRCRPLPVTR